MRRTVPSAIASAAIFLDTNILIYSISPDTSDAFKRDRADMLLARADCVLSIQVLQEFHAQVTCSTRRGALSHELAVELIRGWQRFHIRENTLSLLSEAFQITERYKFSFWDSLVIAAAIAGGCDELMSEDMQNGQLIDGLRIVNPFAIDW